MQNFDAFVSAVKFDASGLVAAIALDAENSEPAMLAWMNREALEKTLDTGIVTYWSRSRKKLWVKGETSGNIQRMLSVRVDCDGDALLFRVRQEGVGAACHDGYRSCFYREWKDGAWVVAGERRFDPAQVYGKS